MDDYDQRDELVDSYVKENKIQPAVKLLCEMIVESARNRDFERAEELRSRLLRVDPFALPQILECTEIIEEFKRHSIGVRHSSLWAKLYKTLSAVEGNALYYALKREVLEENRTVFTQGEQHARLYFIHRGRLAAIWREGNRETVIKEVGPGELIIADGFFSDSVCTISLITLSTVELEYLEKSVLSEWEKEYPALENKLRLFCKESENITQLVRKQGVDRRHHSRVKLRTVVAVQLLGSSGKPVGKPFRGELADISRGGAAFLVPVRERTTARALLGRSIVLAVAMPHQAQVQPKISRKGTVVAITHFPFEGHYLHVRFEELLSTDQMRNLHAIPHQTSARELR